MTQYYKVTFLGLSVIGPEEEARLIKGLQKKFNLSPEKAESLLQKVPIVVKKGAPKEEMERYVKAFEEIGGRVTVEEEPMPEKLEIQTPEPLIEYSSQMRITCPQCGFVQQKTDECKKCGIIISKYLQFQEMARSVEGQVREVSTEERCPPWESGAGFLRAFFQTLREALFSSTEFFRKVASGEGYLSPLIYGVISGIIGFGGILLWTWLFVAQLFPIDKFLPYQYSTNILRLILPLPIQLFFSIFIGSGITHVCLTVVRGNKRGFQTTFRVICYSYSGYVFGIIPLIGVPIGGAYALVLIILGIKEGHGISTRRAALAVFLPTIVGIVLGMFALAFMRFFLGSIPFLGGARV